MRQRSSLCAILGTASLGFAADQLRVTTSQYDNARTGANIREVVLSPRNVNAGQFGKLFSLKVDGDIYAQPLYLPALQIPGKGRHDVIFLATENDSVYAFDAHERAAPLWRTSFLNAADGISAVPSQEVRCPFINPVVGITSTPVIDAQTGTLYVLTRTKQSKTKADVRYLQSLHALDVTTGAERPGSPVEIKASVKNKAGADVIFDPLIENPRSALLLVNGIVYLSWASSCDVGNYHGWIIGYDAHNLNQAGVFNTSPDSKESGIWAGDTGPAADENGNVFVATGNGKFDIPDGSDYGDTLLKLTMESGKLLIRDYYTPPDQNDLNSKDNDLGSGGPVLLPKQEGAHAHLVLIAGKGATLYAIDRDEMGKYRPGGDVAVQTIKLGGDMVGAPAYWNQHAYIFASHDVLKDFAIREGRLELAHSWRSGPVDPGATPTISANGDKDGIVWTVATRDWLPFPETLAVLHAYDAADVARELYNSDENSDRDRAGISIRFSIPTVADGRVYVGTRSELDVYGLLTERQGR
jgi:outer membrane protein assembly factor BamB